MRISNNPDDVDIDKIIEIDMKQMERSTSGVAKRSSKSNNDADDMQKLIEWNIRRLSFIIDNPK